MFVDIMLPGSHNAPWDPSENKIPAGEKILVIKTPKGVYVRTKQGKVFAVHSGAMGNRVMSQVSSSITSSFVSSDPRMQQQQGPMPSSADNLMFSSAGHFMPSSHSSASHDMASWFDQRSSMFSPHSPFSPYNVDNTGANPFLAPRYSQQMSRESSHSDMFLNRTAVNSGNDDSLHFNTDYSTSRFVGRNNAAASSAIFQPSNTVNAPSTSVGGNYQTSYDVNGFEIADQLNDLNALISEDLDFADSPRSSVVQSDNINYFHYRDNALPNDGSADSLAGLLAQPVSDESATDLFFAGTETRSQNVPPTLPSRGSPTWASQALGETQLGMSRYAPSANVVDESSVGDVQDFDFSEFSGSFETPALTNDWEGPYLV